MAESSHEKSQSLMRSCGGTFVAPQGACAPLDCETFSKQLGTRGKVRFPIFWHDPPWHWGDKAIGSDAAKQTLTTGLLTAMLQSELAVPTADGTNTSDPRLLPYRPDRFGVRPTDFDLAWAIDLRLTHSLYHGSPPRYNAEQLRRWGMMPERIDDSASLDAPSWPNDIAEPEFLPKKVEQLRRLTERQAAVWVTVCPSQVGRLAKPLRQAAPDVIVLQCRDQPAALIRNAVQTVMEWGGTDARPELAVTANIVDASDLIFLMAIGADWVGVDAMLEEPLVEMVSVPARDTKAPASSFFGAPVAPPKPRALIQEKLTQLLDDCWSQIASLGVSKRSELDLSTVVFER